MIASSPQQMPIVEYHSEESLSGIMNERHAFKRFGQSTNNRSMIFEQRPEGEKGSLEMAAVSNGRNVMDSQSETQNGAVDRLKRLYSAVNEEKTPLPRAWNPKEKYNYIGLSQNNLRVHYKGTAWSHLTLNSEKCHRPNCFQRDALRSKQRNQLIMTWGENGEVEQLYAYSFVWLCAQFRKS
ncbi:hypothetical protein NQ317_012277 [Molorchus minor]|uniref:Uncharacterized protein n=1 Tax=Molorchus minor TaxID=1323400 RepID=A0ABQ9K152_9CUCU|nr:hypothetical protein NQ317_012277 [Molorchus minor]